MFIINEYVIKLRCILGRSRQSKTVLPDCLRRTAFSVRNSQAPFLLSLLAVIDLVVTHRIANSEPEVRAVISAA